MDTFVRWSMSAVLVPAGGRRWNTPFTELEYSLDGQVCALLAWTATNADAVRCSQAEFDRSLHIDDAV